MFAKQFCCMRAFEHRVERAYRALGRGIAFALTIVGALAPLVYASGDGEIVETDVCIYGGTSGGVIAAVAAARGGKRAIIAEPGEHLGGMTAGGLSAVDIGDPRSIGGITREYFTRLVGHYGKSLAWDKPFQSKGGPATGGAFAIEPHTAEELFVEMVKEAGVTVRFGARLASVQKQGPRITEFKTDAGTIFRAKVFIDATYEGDLMAQAGVSYTLVREGNAKYGETYNGIHYAPIYTPRRDHKKPGANGRVGPADVGLKRHDRVAGVVLT
jgi:flavin-dependent dehydrogenase